MLKGAKEIITNYLRLNYNTVQCILKRQPALINAAYGNANYLLETYKNQDYLFIHINKTGGSSVSLALGENEQTHLSADTIMNFIGNENFKEKFSFAFVRNPYDRVVSQYHYRLQTNQTNIKTENVSFEDWIRKSYVEKDPQYFNYPLMFQPQLDWISDYENELLINFVGKFENINEDFKHICNQIGKGNLTLPHHRKSKRKKVYQDYYTPETKAIITKVFEKDLDYFKYTFDSK